MLRQHQVAQQQPLQPLPEEPEEKLEKPTLMSSVFYQERFSVDK